MDKDFQAWFVSTLVDFLHELGLASFARVPQVVQDAVAFGFPDVENMGVERMNDRYT